MNDDVPEWFVKIFFAFVTLIIFGLGIFLGQGIQGPISYRQGQIDCQKGKIMYIVEGERILKVEK